MKLSSLLSRIVPHKTKTNRFFGLILRESSGVGYAFDQTDTDVEILKSKQFSYSKNFDKVLDDTDEVVYEFETALKVQFNKIIFVLPVCGLQGDGKEVVQPYRTVISEIIHNLELEAMGYIEMTDVLKEELGKHESAVYIEVGKFKTQIVFLRKGEKWNQLSINTNPANVASHLTEFVTKGTNIFVYPIHDGANTNALLAALSDYVVHVCKLDDTSVNLQHLLKKQLIPQEQELDTPVVPSTQEFHEHIENVPIVDDNASIVIDTQSVAINDKKQMEPVTTQAIPSTTPGTVAGFKIFSPQSKKSDDEYVHGPPIGDTLHTGLGKNFDVMSQSKENLVVSETATIQEANISDANSVSESVDEKEITSGEVEPKSKKHFIFKSIGMSLGLIMCIILAGLIVFELYLHKVTVKISVPTETMEIKRALTNIPITKIIEEKNVDVSVDTTGKKEIGERAKGNVVIASFDDKEASFSAGTKLYLNDSVFTLDNDVLLSPATVDTSSGTKQASKKTVAASATFIGTDGNIVKGKEFAVEDYPTSLYYGLSEADFTGGTQQTVSVVAAGDMEKLKNAVKAKAKETSESAKAGTSGDSVTLDEISTVDMSNLNYSAELGDVASVVKAEGSVKAVLYTVGKGALIEILQKAVDEDKGKNYQFLNGNIQYSISKVDLADDEQTCDMNLETNLDVFKSLNIPDIKNRARLKLNAQATKVLKDTYKVSGVQYTYNPVIPLFQLFTPYRTQNIEVEINPIGTASSP